MLTDEQRQRIEANRLVALERKRQREERERAGAPAPALAARLTEAQRKAIDANREAALQRKRLREEREEEDMMIKLLDEVERAREVNLKAKHRLEGGGGLTEEQRKRMEENRAAALERRRRREEEEAASQSSQGLTQQSSPGLTQESSQCLTQETAVSLVSQPHSPAHAPAETLPCLDTPPQQRGRARKPLVASDMAEALEGATEVGGLPFRLCNTEDVGLPQVDEDSCGI